MSSLAGSGPIDRTTTRRLTAIIAGSVIVFMALAAWLIGRRPLDYFYDDGLFYLQIGRAFADGRGLEFTRGIQTNGFHPFWMLICAGIARVAAGDPWRMIAVTGAVTVIIDLAWATVSWFGLRRHFAPWTVGLGLLLAMPYAMFDGVGMESPLAILLFAAFTVAGLALVAMGSTRALLAAALFGGLTVFARLDLAFILLPPAVLLAWREVGRGAWHGRGLARLSARVVPALVIGIAPVATWLAFNRLTFGAATPISGMLKLASAAGHRQFPVLNGMVVLLIAMTIVLTSLAALRWREPRQQFAVAIGLGQLLFVAYLFAAGHREAYAWYFVPLSASLAVTTPAALAGAARLVGRFLPDAGPRPSVVLAGMFGVIIVSSALFLRTSARTGIQREWIVGDQALGRVARANGIDTVLAFDMPGQLAFLHGLNVIAADGLTTNYRFQQVLRQRGIGWLTGRFDTEHRRLSRTR